VVSKWAAYTTLKAAKSRRTSARKQTFSTAFASDVPAASRIPAIRPSTASVCAVMSPGIAWPVAGSSATCPATNTRSPTRTAWAYGRPVAGTLSLVMT